MTVAVVGLGATGAQVVRILNAEAPSPVLLHEPNRERLNSALASFPGTVVGGARPSGDVVVLAWSGERHVSVAQEALERGAHVVSVSDHPGDVDGLLSLDPIARRVGRTVVVGAGFAPGLTCLLARHASTALDVVEEIAVFKAGTGGPMCARQHHHALKRSGSEWSGDAWQLRRGSSGRELTWFPDPLGARDCYRAWLAEPILLHRIFPGAMRITARVAATRRDRMTVRLPMLRPPHADGGPGGIRVEVRGRRGRAVETMVYGVMAHPSVAAGTVAATMVLGMMATTRPEPGARGLGELPDPLPMLRSLHDRGLRAVTYESSS